MLTGETQLRARRTRIKILKAIADRNGVAGFSDIKLSTGLSTGSIYYHLERMGNYVTKNSKYYMITEEGLQLLREVDPKYTGVTPTKRTEEHGAAEDVCRTSEETIGRARFGCASVRICKCSANSHRIYCGGLLTDWQAFFLNAGVIAVDSRCGSNCSIIFDDKILLSCNQIQRDDAFGFGAFSPSCRSIRIFRSPFHWC